jgi:hypothetical protein
VPVKGNIFRRTSSQSADSAARAADGLELNEKQAVEGNTPGKLQLFERFNAGITSVSREKMDFVGL